MHHSELLGCDMQNISGGVIARDRSIGYTCARTETASSLSLHPLGPRSDLFVPRVWPRQVTFRPFSSTHIVLISLCPFCGHKQEVEKALEHGASVLMVNNWDRVTGKLYPKQAMAVRNMIPDQAREL